ncbi:hypothetical protein PQR02_17855 [Paraburkholderia sediminicola]|uniref:Uncharacterized protein n=1 Tax=Paraburkholderia rhynchosiae TaxID=487049 RepID=A0ACC7N834_9BURK
MVETVMPLKTLKRSIVAQIVSNQSLLRADQKQMQMRWNISSACRLFAVR